MFEAFEARLRELARRAGLARVPTPVLVAGMALLTVAVVGALVRWWPKPDDAGGIVVAHAAETAGAGSASSSGAARRPASGGQGADSVGAATAAASEASGGVCVDVVGAVRHPGVYRLAAGQRVTDAVDAAGGPTGDAATDAVNLAAPLQDGTQIAVPTKAEVKAGLATGVQGTGAGTGTSPSAATAGSGAASGALVDLNSADAAALDALPGIGPSTAAKIVADRSANGRFKTVDDLGRVPGIGPKKLDQLKPLVCVR